jgi:hypothetical protein
MSKGESSESFVGVLVPKLTLIDLILNFSISPEATFLSKIFFLALTLS